MFTTFQLVQDLFQQHRRMDIYCATLGRGTFEEDVWIRRPTRRFQREVFVVPGWSLVVPQKSWVSYIVQPSYGWDK